MKKLLRYLLISVALFALSTSSTFADSGKKDLTIGYVVPYEIGWFNYFIEGFELVARESGVKTVRTFNEYNPEMELRSVQDLISRGVDGINITASNPDSAQYATQLANEAGIAVQLTESHAAEGPGKPIADIDFEWKKIYQRTISELRAEMTGPVQIVNIQGFAGSGPVELGITGMKETAKNLNKVSIASVQYGDYRTDKSMGIMQDWIQSGLKFVTSQ